MYFNFKLIQNDIKKLTLLSVRMSSILADHQYTLEFYKNIEENCEINELEKSIIDKINRLSNRVGAPSYQKTPVFKRVPYHYKNKKREYNEDWEAMRNFKRPNLKKIPKE